MSDTALATTIATEFNERHPDSNVRLEVVYVAGRLTRDEVLSFASEARGLMLPGRIFAVIRGRRASQSEASTTGRLLASMGYPSEQHGPSRFYLLDNTLLPSAD